MGWFFKKKKSSGEVDNFLGFAQKLPQQKQNCPNRRRTFQFFLTYRSFSSKTHKCVHYVRFFFSRKIIPNIYHLWSAAKFPQKNHSICYKVTANTYNWISTLTFTKILLIAFQIMMINWMLILKTEEIIVLIQLWKHNTAGKWKKLKVLDLLVSKFPTFALNGQRKIDYNTQLATKTHRL